MNDPTAWVQAARPLAQVNILVPLLFGQAMAFAMTGRFELGWLWLCAWLGLLVQLLIVFANDYADRETDGHNATFARVSGGSRVVPEGRLTARANALSFIFLRTPAESSEESDFSGFTSAQAVTNPESSSQA